MKDITLITETDTLTAFCQKIADSDYITVDTEFLREKTYWPKLCLIQVACPGFDAIIDPLADSLDLSPFFELMKKPDLIKVFHACRQDLEIFYQKMGSVPTPIFDTQIAAMVLGHGDQIGYETLVNRMLNRSLDKSARFTDWSLRPLNGKQLAYALSDVTHLCDIYELFRAELDRTGRESWLGEEMKTLISPSTLEVDPDEAWRRIKSRGHNPRFLGILKEIAAWREREAQSRNLPKNRILRDEALLDVAGTKPRSAKELTKIRGVSDGFAEGKMGVGLLQAVDRALSLPDSALPKVKKKERLPDGVAPLMDLLKVLLKHECEQHQVAARIVASGDDLERIAAEEKPDVAAMQGWRYDIFGKRAMELKTGKIAMSVRGRSIRIIDLAE